MSDTEHEMTRPFGNVLLALSPFSPDQFSAQVCIDAATALRKHGAARADLTMDPRHVLYTEGKFSRGYPVREFTRVAECLSNNFFGPVVGQSALYESGLASKNNKVRPDLVSLTTVGDLFARATDHTFSPSDKVQRTATGRDIGLVLYLAIHAKTPAHKPYEHLAFPDLSRHAQQALATFNSISPEKNIEPYGPLIDLNAIRKTMRLIQMPVQAPIHKETHRAPYIN